MVEYEINARGVAGMEQLVKKILIDCGLQVTSINTIDDFYFEVVTNHVVG